MDFPKCGDLFEGRYRLDEIVGEGGSATVFRALDTSIDRMVALKTLHPDTPNGYSPSIVRRFDREARISAALRNAHTVRLYTAGRSVDGLIFMVFELVAGEDLAAVLQRKDRFEPDETVRVLRQILESLHEAHTAGLLHRDIKPENIRMWRDAGDELQVKLLDFGIARAIEPEASITKTGEVVGTPRYMAPEALMELPLSPASDIYSVGIVAFEMLFGRDALHGNQWHEQIERVLTGHVFAFKDIERIPKDLRGILDRMVTRDASDRYPSAAAVLKALDAAKLAEATELARASPSTTLRFRRASATEPAATPWWVWLCGVLLGFGLLVLGYRALRSAPEPAAPPARPIVLPMAAPPEGEPVADFGTNVATDFETHDAPDDEVRDSGRIPDFDVAQDGCERAPPVEQLFVRSTTINGVEHRWLVRVPTDYEAGKPRPVLMLFHHDKATADAFLAQTGFGPLADSGGPIILSMQAANDSTAWFKSPLTRLTSDALQDLARLVCVDPTRIFVVSHGRGGEVAEQLSCEPWVNGIAITSHLPRDCQFGCEDPAPLPIIHIAPSDTKHVSLNGSAGCGPFSKGVAMSLQSFRTRWSERNRSEEARETKTEYAEGECIRYHGEAPFVSCVIAGGFGWPGSAPRSTAQDPFQCDGRPSNFPSASVIWKFFSSVPRNKGAQLPDQ